MTTILRRKEQMAIRRRFPTQKLKKLLGGFDEIKLLDRLMPGWETAKVHWINVDGGMDLVYELPLGIFIRGWDFTGAINRRR